MGENFKTKTSPILYHCEETEEKEKELEEKRNVADFQFASVLPMYVFGLVWFFYFHLRRIENKVRTCG